MKIKKVGVVGFGQMGSGIAQINAHSGYETLVSDLNEDQLNKGLKTISVSLEKGIAKGKVLRNEIDSVLNQISTTTNIADFATCDLVISAIPEIMDEKKKLFQTLDEICPYHTILASASSCLPITEFAMVTTRAKKVIGTHFFYPVPAITLVELITTILTSKDTIRTMRTYSESLGKSVIISKDEPGFIVNRLMGPFILEAIRIVENHIASKEDVDISMVLGCNHPMGPLRLADFIGLDDLLYMANSMYEEHKDAKYSPPLILKRMVEAGHLGKKTGKGFYEYDVPEVTQYGNKCDP